jgi:hypothetical protein
MSRKSPRRWQHGASAASTTPDEQTDLWRKHLAGELSAIYGEQAVVVVVFVSAEYAARSWTRLQRRAALAGAARELQEYVLPAAGAVRAGEADPRRLGVHAATSVPRFPMTSRRSTCRGMRSGRVRVADRRVLGGETRRAAEAVRELLAD